MSILTRSSDPTMPRPVIPVLVSLTAGISCSYIFRVPDVPLQVILAFALLCVLIGYINKWGLVLDSAILLSFFVVGILEMNVYRYPHPNDANHISNFLKNEKITVEGMIADNPQMSQEKTELVVSVFRIFTGGEYHPVSGRVLLAIRSPSPFEYGDVIRFRCRLRPPHNFNNPGGFDYEQYLRFRGVLVRGFIDDTSAAIILRKGMGNILRMQLERFRNLIRTTILNAAPETEGKIIQAMILGNQMEIPKDIMEKFNRTGTTHIIAISGFNIGIVAIFSLFMIRFSLRRSEYLLMRWNVTYISTLFTILLIILYTLIAGAGISVVRASVMVVIFTIAILLNRQSDLYNTLAMAAFLILIVSPFSLFDVSFQLSFSAVTSLLFLTPRLVALLPQFVPLESSGLMPRDRLSYYLRKALHAVIIFFFASLSATLATLPLILYYFNRLSLVTLIANFFVVPILGIITTPLCLFIILTAPISITLTDLLIKICVFLVKISLYLIDWLSALPWSSIFVPTPSPLEIIAFYLLLVSAGFCLDRFNNRQRTAIQKRGTHWEIVLVFLIIFFIADTIQLYLQSLHRGRLTLTAVDVGQGTATFVRFPGGKKMLVDGGGFFSDTFDVGRYIIAPFLWHERVNQVDIVVLTHPHPDHLQGLLFILGNFQVGEVWTNGQWSNSPLYDMFQQIIHERRITLRVLSAATPDIEIGGVTMHFLNPVVLSPALDTKDAPSNLPALRTVAKRTEQQSGPLFPSKERSLSSEEVNDRSLVIQLSFGGTNFLLPGDIAEKSELRLVQSDVDLRSDVLFVSHHGGFHSSTVPFLQKVKPRIAIISCGADNPFGFPHEDVLCRLEHLRSRVYRTDRDGAVTIVADGHDIGVTAFLQGHR